MVNQNTIGRMKCPVCGEDMQDVRVNKNGNLYMICDNNCRVNFPARLTKKIKPALAAGRNFAENGLFITALTFKGAVNAGQTENRTTTRNFTTGTNSAGNAGSSGNSVVRRTDGQPRAVEQPKQQPSRFGQLAGWLAGDDDEE